MWKDFFYYSRREKQGIIILVVLILAVMAVNILLANRSREAAIIEDKEFEKEYAEFVTSLKEIKDEKQKPFTSRQNAWRNNQTAKLFPFDPNSADSATFLRLGLSSGITNNILKYRNKGGRFRKTDDFKKIYGITAEKYNELYDYIRIPQAVNKPKDTIRLIASSFIKDTLKIFKYQEGTIVNLNQADTSELKKIPGIGSYIANTIVNYRNRLGGFYHISQLEEIDLDTKQLAPWLTIEDNKIKRINLNTASIEKIRKHPYFNFYQAKVIVEYRKKKGKLKGLHQLSLYEEFTEEDFYRMKHYVCFED